MFVAGRLTLTGVLFYKFQSNSQNLTINMRKLAEAQAEGSEGSVTEAELISAEDAVVDVSDLREFSTSTEKTITINGKSQYGNAFLEYYNPADTENTAITEIKNLQDADKRNSYVRNIRSRINTLMGNSGPLSNIVLKDMKIHDYIIGLDSTLISCSNNAIEYSIGTASNILTNDDVTYKNLRNLVTSKNLTIVDDTDTDVVYDFYANFINYNILGNSFVKWPANIQIPLSSIDENYDYGGTAPTEFDFKTNINPSQGNEHDLSVTNGLVQFHNLKLSGNNSSFKNRILLNGSLDTVTFASENSCVSIDATSLTSDKLSLKFADNSGNNTIKDVPLLSDNQTIAVATGKSNSIKFSTSNPDDDTIKKVYNLNELVMGEGSNITVGRNTTLII